MEMKFRDDAARPLFLGTAVSPSSSRNVFIKAKQSFNSNQHQKFYLMSTRHPLLFKAAFFRSSEVNTCFHLALLGMTVRYGCSKLISQAFICHPGLWRGHNSASQACPSAGDRASNICIRTGSTGERIISCRNSLTSSILRFWAPNKIYRDTLLSIGYNQLYIRPHIDQTKTC